MGAGLLAKAECQPTSMLNVKSLSRASPLPHWFCGVHQAVFKNLAESTGPQSPLNPAHAATRHTPAPPSRGDWQ
ncbi:hypothetical protein EAH78_22600 [Pseudomonas arsenicoxydans]|uniref:Uncharacterized protein n=1 Tax=Pseudomonas arsenicoxydans TaxID=702115 RepID=A0A502HP56_9PSED|nr:hypothetical protein EAH78_22600 [Pseudomonas arsenicoxydans]